MTDQVITIGGLNLFITILSFLLVQAGSLVAFLWKTREATARAQADTKAVANRLVDLSRLVEKMDAKVDALTVQVSEALRRDENHKTRLGYLEAMAQQVGQTINDLSKEVWGGGKGTRGGGG